MLYYNTRYCSKRVNSMGHVLFPFAGWQHDHAQTPLACETSMTRARRPWAGGW